MTLAASRTVREYGRDARIGVATPQANPTVEAELQALMPPDVLLLVTRLTSPEADPLQRLVAYLEQIDTAIASFGGLPLDAFGFACTASSYLIGAGREAMLVDAAERRYQMPVVTAAAAIETRLHAMGATRIGVVSPYPGTLHTAALAYWQERGFAVVGAEQVAIDSVDLRSIYGLGSDAADAASQRLQSALAAAGKAIDVVLFSGTGMASLALLSHDDRAAPAQLSSNYCLALELLRRSGASGNLRHPAAGASRRKES